MYTRRIELRLAYTIGSNWGKLGTDSLFDCDTLGQIPWLVDVAAAADGDVVGEELEGDDFEDGEEDGCASMKLRTTIKS